MNLSALLLCDDKNRRLFENSIPRHVRLFSAPMCSCFHHQRVRHNANYVAYAQMPGCPQLRTCRGHGVVAVSTGRPVISKYRDSCKVYRDTYRMKSIAIYRCIDEVYRDTYRMKSIAIYRCIDEFRNYCPHCFVNGTWTSLLGDSTLCCTGH